MCHGSSPAVAGAQLALFRISAGMPSVKGDQSSIDLLEHVVKGVHIESRGPNNHRVMPRPLDRINDEAPTLARRPRGRKKRPNKRT